MSVFTNKIYTYDILKNTELPDYSQADIITLHIPYTIENKNFINKKNLSTFKSGATLINTARGPLVNEEDLYEHLINTNSTAAFDAYWQEPYNGKLRELPSNKFFMTPHIASSSKEFVESCFNDFKQLYESN